MTSHSEYNEKTRGSEVAKAFSSEIKGRYIVVTGISKGSLGESTAKALAAHDPALLILASRTPSKLDAVASEIRTSYPNAKIKTVALDLSSQESVRRVAEEIKSAVPQIDIIINNAALITPKRVTSVDGIEGQFATNHLGGFLLTNLLVEKFPAGKTARIVNVSSRAHHFSPIRWSDWNFEKSDSELPESERGPDLSGIVPPEVLQVYDGYNGMRTYAHSKTANILTVVAWNKKLAGKATAYSLHPGEIYTNGSGQLGGQETFGKLLDAVGALAKDLDQGAATTLVAALDPALKEYKGNPYLFDSQFAQAADWAVNEGYAERLWKLSEELVGEKFF